MNSPSDKRTFKVSERRLKELIMAEAVLQALEAGGVDNWSWYLESRQDYINDYFSANDPEWFEQNSPDFLDIAEIEVEKYEEV